jgi:hypothetical protein
MLVSRLWKVCALLLVPNLAAANGNVGAGGMRSVRVSVGEDRIIVLEAKRAPLGRIIDELAAKTGTLAHYSVLPEEPVTATCAGATVKQVMECLLGPGADLMFRYPAGLAKGGSPGHPQELWVLGSSLTGRCSAGTGQRRADQGGPAPAEPGETGDVAEIAAERTARQRADAIARLSADPQADEGTVVKTLETALADEDASVRAQAVYGLARRGGVSGAAALQAGLRDSDPSVRLMAVDSAGEDAGGLTLLREALADSDETVRALAALKLDPEAFSASASEE